jgi:hypothetical protein
MGKYSSPNENEGMCFNNATYFPPFVSLNGSCYIERMDVMGPGSRDSLVLPRPLTLSV